MPRTIKILSAGRLFLPLVVLLLFLSTTDPEKLSLPLLIVPILLLMASIFSIVHSVLGVVRKDISQKASNKLYSLLISLALALVAILRSIGQLTLKDELLFIILAVLFAIYLSHLQPSN